VETDARCSWCPCCHNRRSSAGPAARRGPGRSQILHGMQRLIQAMCFSTVLSLIPTPPRSRAACSRAFFNDARQHCPIGGLHRRTGQILRWTPPVEGFIRESRGVVAGDLVAVLRLSVRRDAALLMIQGQVTYGTTSTNGRRMPVVPRPGTHRQLPAQCLRSPGRHDSSDRRQPSSQDAWLRYRLCQAFGGDTPAVSLAGYPRRMASHFPLFEPCRGAQY
jgi:hypothetical protein